MHPWSCLQSARDECGGPRARQKDPSSTTQKDMASSCTTDDCEGDTATMRTDSLFDEDATSFASTIGRANTSPSGVTTITLEFTIPGATSLRCTPDQGTSSAPDNLFGGESKSSAPLDPWAPKDSMGGRSSPQINPWKGLVRGPASAVPVVIEGTWF